MDTLERSEQSISLLLRAGVLLSGFVVAFGWVLKFIQTLNQPGYEQPTIANPDHVVQTVARSLGEIITGIQHGNSSAWISLGLLLLISLPILRVALTLYLFAKRRDFLFMALTFYVLGLLSVGVIFGKAL